MSDLAADRGWRHAQADLDGRFDISSAMHECIGHELRKEQTHIAVSLAEPSLESVNGSPRPRRSIGAPRHSNLKRLFHRRSEHPQSRFGPVSARVLGYTPRSPRLRAIPAGPVPGRDFAAGE
jgi:hypothetical protein